MDTHPRTCISAGHGYASRIPGKTDPGANIVGSLIEEADWTLLFSRRIVADLKVLYRKYGGDVMLRNNGYYYLADDDAAKAGCDLFVEMHLNSGGGTGCEVFYEVSAGKPLAVDMSARMSKALGLRNRGAKQTDDFAVLSPKRGMVAVLAEAFFADSKADVTAYRENDAALELAVLNSILTHYGWRNVYSRPRLWGSVRRAAYRR